MTDLNTVLVQDWLQKELIAYGLVERRGQDVVFLGDRTDFLIEVKAVPIRKHYRNKPAADFGPDYN